MDTNFQPLISDSEKEESVKKDDSDSTPSLQVSGFKNTIFKVQPNLITNIEDYAKEIQEKAEEYAQKVKEEADLVKDEIEQVRVSIKQEKQEAKAIAADIISQANEEKEAIFKKAKEDAEIAVREEIMKQIQQEYKANMDSLLQLFENIDSLYEKMNLHCKEDLLEIALAICYKVLQRELKVTNEKDFLSMITEALSFFADSKQIIIRMNPKLMEFAKKILPQLKQYVDVDQHITIRTNAKVPLYEPIIESESLRLDLAVGNKFDWIRSQLESHISSIKTEPNQEK